MVLMTVVSLWSFSSHSFSVPLDLYHRYALGEADPITIPQRPLLILHWTEHPDFYYHLKEGSSSFFGCAVSSCLGTSNRSLLTQADAVLIHGDRLNITDLPKPRLPHQRYAFVWQEAPSPSRHLKLKQLDGFFNMMITYTRDAGVAFPYRLTAEGKQEESVPPFNSSRG